MGIECLYGLAWNEAINHVAEFLNANFSGLKLTFDDWEQVERVAGDLKIRFDADGNII